MTIFRCCAVLLCLVVAACSQAPTPSVPALASPSKAASPGASQGQSWSAVPADLLGEVDDAGYMEVDWTAMLPPEELKAIEEGKVPQVKHSGVQRMPQFGTYRVVDAVLGKPMRLPGYVVPLESDSAGLIEFLFVPYFGACIHVPPPPPNQIVHVRLSKPIEMPDMYTPFYLAGALRAEHHEDGLAGSAYSMDNAKLLPYEK